MTAVFVLMLDFGSRRGEESVSPPSSPAPVSPGTLGEWTLPFQGQAAVPRSLCGAGSRQEAELSSHGLSIHAAD